MSTKKQHEPADIQVSITPPAEPTVTIQLSLSAAKDLKTLFGGMASGAGNGAGNHISWAIYSALDEFLKKNG